MYGAGTRAVWMMSLGMALAGLVAAAPVRKAGAADQLSQGSLRADKNNVGQMQEVLDNGGQSARLNGSFADGQMPLADRLSRWAEGAVLHRDSFTIRSVSPALRWVTLDGGREDGLRPGLPLVWLRAGQAMGRARVVMTRERCSGAALENLTDSNRCPVPGERVLVWLQDAYR